MSTTTNITPPRVPLIDPRTGLIAREWYKFFLYLFNAAGGGTADVSVVDLSVEPVIRQPDMTIQTNAVLVNQASPARSYDAEIQNAVLMQRLARYDAAIAMLEGALMQPPEKKNATQYDPLSFCAPYR